MALFARYHMTAADAEKQLKRPLSGDPGRGEQGILAALNADRFDDVRRLLDRDLDVREDFKDLVEARLRPAVARAGKMKSWNVTVPLPVWDEFAKQARLANLPISEVLARAIERDLARQQEALSPVEALDADVRAFHRAAGEVLGEVRQLATRVGAIQELSLRLGRIEAALGVAARR